MKKQPKHVKYLKLVILLIPIFLITSIFYLNYITSQELDFFLNTGTGAYLTPNNRINPLEEVTELTGHLVYFESEIPPNSETITIQTKLKPNLPENYKISLGARNKEEWSYKYNLIYDPELNFLKNYTKINNTYQINNNIPFNTKENIIIATNLELENTPNTIEDYKEELTIINTVLRDAHTFYFYTENPIELKIKKQDLNWYNNTDNLTISIYDLNNNLISQNIIEDDSIDYIDREPAIIQELTINEDLNGIYKLEFSSFDGLIKEIQINTNKIVIDNKIFLANNDLYLQENKESKLYLKTIKPQKLKLLTYHSHGIQEINYNNNIFNFYKEDEPLFLNLDKNEYIFTIPKNDIILEYPGYFAFSEENYFEPFKKRIISLNNNKEYLLENADFIITNYNIPEEINDYIITETTFNIKKDNLFINQNKLSLVFNIPHLSREEYLNYTIPVDWIDIKIFKPGLLK